jgi:hypothetical protein
MLGRGWRLMLSWFVIASPISPAWKPAPEARHELALAVRPGSPIQSAEPRRGGTAADIVMESITPTIPVVSVIAMLRQLRRLTCCSFVWRSKRKAQIEVQGHRIVSRSPREKQSGSISRLAWPVVGAQKHPNLEHTSRHLIR